MKVSGLPGIARFPRLPFAPFNQKYRWGWYKRGALFGANTQLSLRAWEGLPTALHYRSLTGWQKCSRKSTLVQKHILVKVKVLIQVLYSSKSTLAESIMNIFIGIFANNTKKSCDGIIWTDLVGGQSTRWSSGSLSSFCLFLRSSCWFFISDIDVKVFIYLTCYGMFLHPRHSVTPCWRVTRLYQLMFIDQTPTSCDTLRKAKEYAATRKR